MNLNVRDSKQTDYEAFLRIYTDYYIDPKKIDSKHYLNDKCQSGFLVGKPHLYKTMVKSPLFKTGIDGDKIIGFIRADKLSNKLSGAKYSFEWLKSGEEKEAFCEEVGLEIGVIMVDKNYIGKGVGRRMFKELENFVIDKNYKRLYSWVVKRPENRPSFKFHEAIGFEQLAVFNSQKSYGIPNYQSILFVKQY